MKAKRFEDALRKAVEASKRERTNFVALGEEETQAAANVLEAGEILRTALQSCPSNTRHVVRWLRNDVGPACQKYDAARARLDALMEGRGDE